VVAVSLENKVLLVDDSRTITQGEMVLLEVTDATT